MSIPYTQASMANVRAVEGTFISYPFLDEGDTTTKVYNMVCTQRASDYNAAQIALDDPMTNATTAGVIELPFTGDSSAYFVGDTGHTDSPGGMVQFSRKFANIPQSTRTSSGSINHTFPGIGGFIAGTAQESSVSAVSMTAGTQGIKITTTDTMTLVAGDKIELFLKYNDSGDDYVHVIDAQVFVTSVVDTSNFLVDIGRYFDAQTTLNLVQGYVDLPTTPTRPALQQNCPLIESTSYILPGTTAGISSAEDIVLPPIFAPYKIVVAEGSPTTWNRVNVLDSSTHPTANQYDTIMTNGEHIITGGSLSTWMGNIMKQTTQSVKAL